MDWTAGESASVRLIEHSDGKEFGTGFAVWCDQEAAWLVTCAHVVHTRENASLTVSGCQAEVVANGRAQGRDKKIDLAVLRVPGLQVTEGLPLAPLTNLHHACRIPGWSGLGKASYRGDCLEARIVKRFSWTEPASCLVARAFHLAIEKGGRLDKGYSGAPVICSETGAVFAVIATKEEPSTSGSAICISHLEDIWPQMPAELLAVLTASEVGVRYDEEIRAIFVALSGEVSTPEIRTVCRRSTPPELPLDWPQEDTLTGYCNWLLDKRQFEKNGRHPLYDVLAYLKSHPNVDGEFAQRITMAMERLEQHYPGLVTDPLSPSEPSATRPALIEIVFEPRGTPEVKKAYDVHTLWHPPLGVGMQAGPRREHEDGGRLDLKSSERVNDFACELLEALDAWEVEAKEFVFLFRVPSELMLHPFEHWPQDELGIPLGRDYPVVVGARERPWRRSKQLWDLLEPHLGDCLRERFWCADRPVCLPDRLAIAQVLQRIEQAPCVVLKQVPDLSESQSVTLLALLIQRGVSVLFWPRCKEAEEGFCEALDTCLGNQPVVELPLAVRDLRKKNYGEKDPSPARTHLTLLWDDPNRSAGCVRKGRFFTGVS